MRKHMQILPKMAFVQAQSSFSAQLRFLPRASLEVPLKVHVADQAQPVPFTVHAVVTTSDLRFDPAEVDFGHCSIHECVRTSVRLSNLSLLPQDYGFLGVPQFPLPCRAVGVRPPLELSHRLVRFGATAVADGSTATLHISHPGGSQGPRLFYFSPPVGSEVSVVPAEGRLLPGEKCLLQVSFRPRLSDHQIREEAARIAQRAVLLRRQELERSRPEQHTGPQELPAEPAKGGRRTRPPAPRCSTASPRRLCRYVVPCFVSDGDLPADDPQAQAAWSPQNTLYLELHCPAVQPPLVVISGHGHNAIDFQQ
ncbi:hypothetical protein CRUP_013053, partial [Coryphaenoides rupestris]